MISAFFKAMDVPDIGLDITPVDGEKSGYLNQLKSNQFFAAGFGLGALGAASTALKKLSVIGLSILRRKYVFSQFFYCSNSERDKLSEMHAKIIPCNILCS